MYRSHSFLAAIHHLLITDDLLPQASKLSRLSYGRSSPEVVGSNPTDCKRFLSLPASYDPLIPFTGNNAQWGLMVNCRT